MTTPDHTPYLADGDLRTPQDVLEWLDTQRNMALDALRDRYRVVASERRPYREVFDEITYRLVRGLAERLDRERRQACRRGALRTFRHLAWYARVVRRGREAWELDDPAFSSEMAWEYAVDCLAFRAAARAR